MLAETQLASQAECKQQCDSQSCGDCTPSVSSVIWATGKTGKCHHDESMHGSGPAWGKAGRSKDGRVKGQAGRPGGIGHSCR